jgi:hypothetical protein
MTADADNFSSLSQKTLKADDWGIEKPNVCLTDHLLDSMEGLHQNMNTATVCK